MTSPRASKYAPWFCIVPALAGVVALGGWALGDDRLKSLLPGLIAMNPLTAICFITAAVALWLRLERQDCQLQRIAAALGLIVAAIGGSKLGSYIFGYSFQIDQWMFHSSLGDNRMAPNTALCFLLIGASLAGLEQVTRRGFWPAQIAALVVATISLMSLIGYSYGATSLYQMASYVPMALNTAAAFGVLASGILVSRTDRGVMAVVLDAGPGGMMARKLLPAAVIIPWLLGWLRIVGERRAYYDTEFGAALMIAVTALMFVVVVARIAAALNGADRRRQVAERRIRRLNSDLEARVAERTTELAAANADLVHKNQENEMFVYSVSHDLRSPLVNLQGFSQELSIVLQSVRRLIVNEELSSEETTQGLHLIDEDMRRSIRFIQTAVARLGNIIDALLRLSRAGRVEYQPQAIDATQLISRIVESMSSTLFDRGAVVEIGALPSLWGDPLALEQVFANLIGNASTYLDPARPGRIAVGCLPNDAAAADYTATTLFVEDNGLGIDPAYQGKVFQALKRLHPEVAPGEGIGLAVVKRIVERHGGEIWFESTVGQGTTFFVKLPTGVCMQSTAELATTDAAPNPERSIQHDRRSARNPIGGRR